VGRIRRHLSYANVAATLALVFGMTGGAVAASGGFSSGGTLRACANEEGAIRLLKAGKHCKKGQKGVSWNQTGPAGAKGATGVGVPGAAGPAGAAGARGATGEAANVSWARVSEKGVLEGSSHGVVKSEAGGIGIYGVTFDHDISKCALVATGQSLFADRFASDALPDPEQSTIAVVLTFDVEGDKAANAPFSVVAYC
jgi:hypothetical protein